MAVDRRRGANFNEGGLHGFTTRGRTLYAVALAWPASGTLRIQSLAENAPNDPGPIGSVELLGARGRLHWSRDAQALTITLLAHPPCDYADAFKITPASRPSS